MPGRKRASEKHPALVSKLRQERLGMSDDELQELRGWYSLSRLQRDFVALLPEHVTISATCRAMGQSEKWYWNQAYRHPVFKWAVETRVFTGAKLAKMMVETGVGGSIVKLTELIEDKKVSDRVRLDAIKHLHKIQGIGADEPSRVALQQNNFIDHQTVVSISKNRKRRQKQVEVVEGELVK